MPSRVPSAVRLTSRSCSGSFRCCRQTRRAVCSGTSVRSSSGGIYIIGQVLDNSRLSPPETVAGNLFFLNVFDEGQAYTEQEHQDWLTEAGFAPCERLLLPNR